MARGAVISAVLTLKDKDFTANAKKATGALTDTEREALKARNGVAKFGDSAKSGFKKVATGAASIVSAVGIVKGLSSAFNLVRDSMSTAFARIDTMEQFDRTMTELTGSAEDAQAALDATNEAVVGTAYGLDVAAKGVQDFVTRGMDVEKATDVVSAWGDAVAFYGDGSNEQLASVSDALGKMTTKGTVEMDQLNRLFDVGIDAVGMYAQATGQSSNDVQEALSAGEISSEEFIDTVTTAMMEGTNGVTEISGAAKEAGASWSGSFDNMRAAVARGVTSVIDSIDEMLTSNGLPDMREMVSNFGSRFEGVLGSLGDKIPVVADYLVGMYDKAKPGIDWFKDTAFPAVKSAIGGVVDGAKDLYHFVVDNWSLIGPVVAGITAGIASFRAGVVLVTAAQRTWATVTTGVQIAKALLNKTLVVSPLGWVALAIGAVVTAGILLWKNWDTVTEKASELWSSLKSWFGDLKNSVVTWWGNMMDRGRELWQNFLNIKDNAITMASDVKTNILDMKDKVVGWFGDLKDGAVEKFDEIIQAAKDLPGKIGQGIKDFASDAWDGITSLADGLIDSFKDALGIASPSQVFFDMAKWIVEGLVNGLSAENLKELGKNIFSSFAGGVLDTFDKIRGFFSGDSISYNAGAGVNQWAGLAAQALSMTGQMSEANLNRMLMQMATESGGNPNAINKWDINWQRGIPSKGLMQVIDPTFRAYAMPGFDKNVYDPLSNMLASIRYSLSRYGSLSRAWRGVGYEHGGRVTSSGRYLVGEAGPELVTLPRGSKVTNNQDSKRMKSGGNIINININGYNKSTNEILSELVPALKLKLANM